jgi:hypothetical protein
VFDEDKGSLHIEVSTEEGGRGRYFVPDTTVDIGVGNVGMFANDVAYTGGCTEEEYDDATARMSGKFPTTLRRLGIQIPVDPMPSNHKKNQWDCHADFSNPLDTETPSNPTPKLVLELAWRMEDNGGILVPTWPVVILSRNVAFTNSQPMEVGVNYGWKYWEETRKRNEVGDLD